MILNAEVMSMRGTRLRGSGSPASVEDVMVEESKAILVSSKIMPRKIPD